MGWKEQYWAKKDELLNDTSICAVNRRIFGQFLEFAEYRLKRRNHLPALDDGCYKTLLGYLNRLRNVNQWFKNKPWKQLTQADIKRVYDDLEEGRITNRNGKPFADRSGYYNKIFKSKPFRLAGKAELAREVIEFAHHQKQEVRFVTEEIFRKMVSTVRTPSHQLLFWLAWDIGENINTLLRLQRRDFVRQNNPHTHEPEYLVNLPKEKLKRSRTARSEPTLYPETVRHADVVLAGLGHEDPVFNYGYRQALKVMHSVRTKTKATCLPQNHPVRWKDLRSGMACHLLKLGWNSDEVNARLGHTPGSKALSAYINYLAIDRHRPKRKLLTTSLEQVHHELDEAKRREALLGERLGRQGIESDTMRKTLEATQRELHQLRALVNELRRAA